MGYIVPSRVHVGPIFDTIKPVKHEDATFRLNNKPCPKRDSTKLKVKQ